MQYKIVTDKQEYIITEEDNMVVIGKISSLKDFLLDLDDCDTPYIIQIKEEGEN